MGAHLRRTIDKVYLRRLRGGRFARTAEDNAAPRRICSSRTTLRVTSLRYFMLFADGGVNATAVRRCGAAANCATLRVAFSQCFYTLPFVRTKGNRKTAAVKRFRGRPCAYAESDACGTFEAIKSSLTQTFSRLGKARTSSALPSAYRKRSPILYAPSPRPPFSRNRFCRG